MAEQDNLADLISYLKSLGFEGSILEATLRKEYERFDAFMYIDHYIAFGNDLLRYELHLVYDRQFNAYRLDQYEVFYRKQVNIEHKIINGIDTQELERLMAEVDWHYYFFQEMNDLPTEEDLSGIFEKMEALSDENNPNSEGLKIKSRLIYKYWPSGNWNDEANELQDIYETSKVFKAEHLGIANATLAYHITSGNFGNLHELISRTGIEAYPGFDLKGLLAVYLSKNSERFDLSFSCQQEDGIIDFHIPVCKQEGRYEAEYMELTFTRFPEIKHGVFSGIDTANLKEQMKLIDWEHGDLYYLDENEDVILYPYVQTIKDSIDRLNADTQTQHIGEYLQIKYWGESVMEMYVNEETWQMKDWEKTRQRFTLDEDTRTIGNLMQGRPVHSSMLSISDAPDERWCVIDATSVADNGLNPIKYIEGISRGQIETMVSMLSVDGTVWTGDIVRSIQQGEKVPVDINGINGAEQVIVSVPANPAEQRLEVTTPEGRSIPFNFKMDPDWCADQISTRLEQQEGKKDLRTKKNQRGKTRRKGM